MWPFQPNPLLLELAQRELPGERHILVTGATGFVGSHLAHVLHAAGHRVTITGRSQWRVSSPGRFIAADISKRGDVDDLCQGQEIVIHCAASTSPWGKLSEHRKVNVVGTQNIVDACLQHQVQRMVHVSSTAIFFQFRDLEVDDTTPLPRRNCNAYAHTKAEAEAVVNKAIRTGLNAYIVRARAVFGPGDNALLPRLIAAASDGGLNQIGAGRNRCDLTYIDNLLAGLILAANPSRPTGTCTITNQEPINLWQLLRKVIDEMVPQHRIQRSVPYWLADSFARLSQWKHQLIGKRGEPKLTRYGVGLLAKEQIFRSKAAEVDLSYQPLVTMEDGLERTMKFLRNRTIGQSADATCVKLQIFPTGYLLADRRFLDRSGIRGKIRVHATVAIITHPDFGPILFDAGYSPAFFDATSQLPFRIYRWLTRVTARPEWAADAWLRREGIEAEKLQLILLSHFHGDHICSLRAFPTAQIVTLEKSWRDARDRQGMSALRRAILPALVPEDADARVHTIAEMHWPGIGPFPRCHDLFGDGSIRLFELDGHATGQMGALLNVEGGRQVFLVADACWTRVEIERRLQPTTAFRLVAADYSEVLRTRSKLFELASLYPQIEFVCTHCPEVEYTSQLP